MPGPNTPARATGPLTRVSGFGPTAAGDEAAAIVSIGQWPTRPVEDWNGAGAHRIPALRAAPPHRKTASRTKTDLSSILIERISPPIDLISPRPIPFGPYFTLPFAEMQYFFEVFGSA